MAVVTTETVETEASTVRHLAYLDRMIFEGRVSPTVAQLARDIFLLARKAITDLPVPAAMASDDGLGYQWDFASHRLTIDIENDGACDWFYSHRDPDHFDGEEFTLGMELPEELIKRLKLFVPRI
jgi:hypothetical protein